MIICRTLPASDQWQPHGAATHREIYNRLREAATLGALVSYSDIAPLAGLDMNRADHRELLGELLGEISEAEHRTGRPLLSVLVVHAGDDGRPGHGFFALSRDLGLLRPGEDETCFFVQELGRVFAPPDATVAPLCRLCDSYH